MKKKQGLTALSAVLVLFSLLSMVAFAADPSFGNVQFQNLWVQADRLVGSPGVTRPYTWGPSIPAAPNAVSEPYAESPGGQRVVQYFDKARMELNNPATGLVTAGLIVRDLVAGLRQDGDNTFTNLPPSQTQVAGDAVSINPNAPVYASFKNAVTLGNADANSKTSAVGSTITQFIDKAGTVTTITPPESLTVGAYQAETGHNIAKVFEDFKNQRGAVTDPLTGTTIQNQLIYTDNPTARVFGYAISEPFWVNTKIAGVERTVLVQLFQRRVLTYNPALPAGSRVEMGNVGQHYYQWRYVENAGGGTTPPPTPTAPLDYTQYRASYLKTGNIPLGGTGNSLSYSTGGAVIASSPVYDSDKQWAFIGTNGGGVVAVNISNFTNPVQAWRFQPTGVNFNSPLELYNGVIYVGGADGKVYAIKESDGTAAWTSPYAVPGSAKASPLAVDTDTIYFTAADGKLYAITLANATPKWQIQPSGVNLLSTFAPVVASDGRIYVVGNDNKVYAYNKDGSPVVSSSWTATALDDTVLNRPSYANGRLYVATNAGSLYALNSNGTIQSQKTFAGADPIYTSPAIVTVGSNTLVFVGTDGGKVYGLDATNVNSTPLWTFNVPAAAKVQSSVAVVNGFVYFGAQDSKVYKVEASNAANSTTLVSASAAFNTNAPIVNKGYLIIGGSDGPLYVVK